MLRFSVSESPPELAYPASPAYASGALDDMVGDGDDSHCRAFESRVGFLGEGGLGLAMAQGKEWWLNPRLHEEEEIPGWSSRGDDDGK